MLLGVPAGQKGRQHTAAGNEGIVVRPLAHGRTIADEERRARWRRRNAGETASCGIRPGAACPASLILVTFLK